MGDTVERARALFGPLRWDGPPVSDDGQFVLPIGTVTLVLGDVEGSTRAWETQPDEMRTALGRLDEVVDGAVSAHHGVKPVEQGEGDSFVAAFSKASDALAAALDIQQGLDGSPLRVRVGIHTGEVQLRDEGNYVGPALNRAARLRDAAHGGQVVLSQVVHDLVADHLPDDVTLKDLGSHRLRDLGRPEHVFQIVAPKLAVEFPALRSLDHVPNNLPVQLTSFVGREPELAVLRKLLAETRMLTLTGAGGCGKTRLALEVAARSLEDHPDGAWLVDLAPLSDPKGVPAAVGAAVGVRPQQGRRLVDTLVDHLLDRHAILVLDNCEHLLEGSARVAQELLVGCQRLTILATSREQLGVPGETPWLVPSLSVPAGRVPPRIEALGQYEAVQLFVERARRTRPNFAVSNETAAALAGICHRLDGIPLAVELAAARCRVLTVEQILEGLDDCFRLLTGGARTAVPRQQTLRASVDWSYRLLSAAERVLLERLSVFAGGFTLDAAEAVAGVAPVDRLAVMDLLQSLVDKSLVEADLGGDRARYRMLETIRQYAAEQLATSEDHRAAVRARHRDYYLALAEQAAPHLEGLEQQGWVDVLAVDHQNLRAAFNWAHGHADAEAAQRLVAALFWYMVISGHIREGEKLCRLALELEGAPAGVRARALVAAAQVGQLSYDFSTGPLADEAAELARHAGDRVTEGRALYLRGWRVHVGDYEAGLGLIEAGVDLLREAQDRWGLAMGLLYAGLVQDSWPARSRPPLEECEALCRDIGDRYMLSTARYNLARALLAEGRTTEAEAMLRAVVDHTRRTADTFNLTIALSELALLRAVRGDFDEALALLEDNIQVFRRGRSPWISHESQAFGVLGSVLHMTGRTLEARTACDTALAKSIEVGVFKDYTALSLASLARVEHDLGDTEAACKHIAEALALAQECAVTWPVAVARAVAARLALADGDIAAAERLAHEALAMSHDLGYHYCPEGTFDTLETVARLSTDPSGAARLLGAVDAAYTRADRVRFPAAAEAHDATIERLRGEIGEDEYDVAYAEGGRLSVDDAVEYARRGRGRRRRPSSGWASLTPTELEVVKLVTEGLSNPQIAERMFISRKTVTTHLTHVFAKLGVASRSALSAEAVRQGVAEQKGVP